MPYVMRLGARKSAVDDFCAIRDGTSYRSFRSR
jgi:hypothetical protein